MSNRTTDRGTVLHEGEQAVQQRVGEGSPRHGSPMFDAVISRSYAEFLESRPMVVLGSVGDDDRVWASALTGAVGFVRVVDATSLCLADLPAAGDPLAELVDVERPAGLIAVDHMGGRRVRANGQLVREGDELLMRTEQVLRNCKKYIQRREPVELTAVRPARPVATSSDVLTPAQQRWIATADTFFLASHSPEHGSDVSHRGGPPGFVTVVDGGRLTWPDYVGNSFYMTFGNLELNPHAGLLFLDWERGHTLHLTGECRVDWNDRSEPGAQRTVHFRARRVIQVDNAASLRWKLMEYSSFNP